MSEKRKNEELPNDDPAPANRWIGLGVAAGVGSAAIAAALLYTSRARKRNASETDRNK